MTVAATAARPVVLGDADIAAVGALLADPRRCRVLLALDDGRALPASVLAREAGVSQATASSHLRKLLDGGLLTVEQHGRHRYYRLADRSVGQLIEVLARFAPAQPVRSLRQSIRARALRDARTCYDHLAGRLGVALMAAMIKAGHLTGGDGTYDPDIAVQDKRTGYGRDISYQLTIGGHALLDRLGVNPTPAARTARYCIDWSEQHHHLAGSLGRHLHARLAELDWIRPDADTRAVHVTPAGEQGLHEAFGVTLTA